MSAVESYTLKLTPAEAEEIRNLVRPGTLRRKRSRIYRENLDYVRMVARQLRSLAKRAGADIEMLPLLRAMKADLEAVTCAAIDGCRNEGYSWEEIAQRLGTTRQAAQQWYARNAAQRATERQRDVDTSPRATLAAVQ